MQLRYHSGHTSEAYVTEQGWRTASLACCPRHPRGGCGFARHGTYRRKAPSGARVARWYCRQAHETFSLLPDCLAAGLTGTLAEVEAVVLAVEQAPSLERAADVLRPDIELPGAVRWTRRRVRAVRQALAALRALLPERLGTCAVNLVALRAGLGVAPVLPALREVAAPFLQQLPAPLGFSHRPSRGGEARRPRQHDTGPDPPLPAR